ncbi:hypothetical protein FMM05_00950 [Flavobacterium zepuense]|uniref:Uncharacterized protein n=1 Tax=Flavobacterium zepuense TaxID=2593302 RepID=A0A552V9T3_9FLAO|nr:hypothetical protein [Flavobacterium zepuense]TRW27236.1 hypothetical protein FMM05_00950 [Flavobacterium zepuense]
MQSIKSTKHQDLLKALEKFEALFPGFGNNIPEGREVYIRDKAAELKCEYDYYQNLLKALENCINSYENKHESLRKVMYPCLRRMNTKSKKR